MLIILGYFSHVFLFLITQFFTMLVTFQCHCCGVERRGLMGGARKCDLHIGILMRKHHSVDWRFTLTRTSLNLSDGVSLHKSVLD